MDSTPTWAQPKANPDTPSWATASKGTPTAATPPATQQPGWYKPESLWDKIQRVDNGLVGSFQSAALGGLMAQPVRAAMEALDTGGVDAKLRQQYPGRTDQWYNDQKHTMYGDALTGARQDAAAKTQASPYFGSKVGNFAAGVIGSADPTFLVGGPAAGAAVEKLGLTGLKAGASRIAINAASNAALSSASNAAAQGMDILEGQKKDFDVKENLQAAQFGGAFGGVHGAVGEVAPFVADMFKNRGKDTLPSARPDGTNAPLTGNTVNLTPEQQGTLRNLLKSGSVDDIKGFLADKQGPKPSWADVDQVVQFRDSLPDSFVNKPNVDEALGQHIDDTNHLAVQTHIGEQTAGWKNAPDVEYHRSVDDIQDPALKDQVTREMAASGTQPGGFLDADGKVHVFTDAVKSPEQANALLYHEGLGHFGLQQKFGTSLDNMLKTLLKRNVGQFGKDVDRWQKENPNAYGGDRTRAAEEVLAEMSEGGRIKPSIGDALAAHVRRFGRAMGMKLSYSDAEVSHIMSMAHDAVVNGKGRNVGANGFRSPLANSPNDPGNKYMFTGPRAKNFDPEHLTAFTANDGIRRNEIDDSNAKLNFPEGESTGHYKLGDVLDHPELYDAYPELRDLSISHEPLDGYDGQYHEANPVFKPSMKVNSFGNDKLSTTLHEAQHGIQDIEQYPDFVNGDSSHLSQEEYDAHPSEREAYATEGRKELSLDERINNSKPKFISKTRLDALSKDYAIKSIDEAYKATDEEYVPTHESWAETNRKALDAGFSPSQIKSFGKTPELAKRSARITASAKVLDQKIAGILAKLDTPDWSLRDEDNLRQAIADHSYVLAKLRDERAETARALNIAKLGYTRAQMESFGAILKERGGTLAPLGDSDALIKFARQMKNVAGGKNPNGMNALVGQLQKPNWEDYVITAHNAMMLSGLSTHVKAPQDMMMGIGRDLLHNVGALPISAGREALRAIGVKVQPGVHPIEVGLRLNGIFRAALDADTYRATTNALVKGNTNPSGFSYKQNARIPVLSKVIDLISAQDTFFRAFATNMHLYGLGGTRALEEYRNAHGGRNPTVADFDQVATAGAAYARQPSAKMLKEAHDAANENLLLNKNKLTEPLDRWKATTSNSSPARRIGAFIANFLTPFVRVESNSLYNRVIKNSPLALLDPGTLRDIKGGGAKADVATARVIFGFATFAAAWHAYEQKKITGEGPDNPDKLAALKATGWRPGATHENGQYNTGSQLGSSFNPLDIHNQTALSIAALHEAWDKGANQGQVSTAIKFSLMSIMSRLSDLSYVSDLAPAMDALTARGVTASDKVGRYLGSEAATMSPNLTAQAARVTDQSNPQTDDPNSWTNTIKNSVQATIPGLRDKLPNQVDPFGNPVQGGASFAGQHSWMPQDNRITGGNHVDETTDPAEKELGRLSQLFTTSIITPVQKTITVGDLSKFTPSQIVDPDKGQVKLSPKQFEEYQTLAGKEIVAALRDEMNTEQWANMSDTDRGLWIKSNQTDIKKAVRGYLYGAK